MSLLPALALIVLGAAPPAPEPTATALLHNLAGHTSTVRGSAFSPDDRILATVCDGGVLNLYDVGTGKVTATTKSGPLSSVDFSRDGKLLVTVGSDRTVRLFDAKTLRELKTFAGHTGGGYVARFTPDDKHIVSGAIDTVARVWEVASGKEVRTLNSGTAYGLAVSSDGKLAITSGGTQELRLWNLATGEKVRDFTGHTSTVVWLEFSRDTRTVASCSYDGTVRLWETRTGKQRLSIGGFGNSPRAAAFTRDGRFLAVVAYDGTTRIFETSTGKELFNDKSRGNEGYAVAFSRDGRRLCGGGQAGKMALWDVSAVTRKKEPAEMTATAFDDHWKDLGSGDVGTAYKAVAALSTPGALKHFAARFVPPKPLTDEAKKRAPALIRDLADDNEDRWRKASEELASYGPSILAILKAALEKETDPDAKLRLVVTIRRADVSGSDSERLPRAVEALERIGTAEAVKLLENLAKGTNAEAATEAKASLARLANRE